MTLDLDLIAAALPNYEIVGEIGRGGWGIVLHGRHRALGREVAIKQLPRELALRESALDRFVDEARIIGQLDHPHILKVYDFVEHDGLWLIVMEYLSGGTLWDRFLAKGVRSDEACAIAMAVCAGLVTANEHGILHRDIKPENILFTHAGVPRLGDFGIAKDLAVDMRRTRVGDVVGTPTYMSPEQAMGDDVTPACDVYSLAVVLYELLAGRLPFEEARTPTQQLVQRVSESPAPLALTAPDVPTVIADVVMDALETRPQDRTATAQAFGVSLARAAGEAYGTEWLRESGITFRGGGRIEAAAHRGPTMGAPTQVPTLVRPSPRVDHFRPDDPAIASMSDPAPTNGPAVGLAAATIGPPTADPSVASRPTTPPSSPASKSNNNEPAPQSSESGSHRRFAAIGALVFMAVLAAIVVFAATRGDDPAAGTDDIGGAPLAAAETTSAPVTTTTPATTTSAPATTTSAPATTTIAQPGEQTCPVATRCAFIDSVAVDGDSLVIEWTAIGFEPSFEDGFVHVHFFWDIYSADQVGTNAATFGVAQAPWEIAEAQPFRSASEVRVQNRPVPANQVCVTAANFAHAVVNPLHFDCVPLPDGM